MKYCGWLLIPILISAERNATAELTFGKREKVPVVSSSSQNEVGMSVYSPADGMGEVMVFGKSGGSGYHDLQQSRHNIDTDQWSRPTRLGKETSSRYYEDIPHVTADGLTLLIDDGLWFNPGVTVPHRPGGFGAGDIWVATRESTETEFGELENLGAAVNSRYYDGGATLSADGLTLLFDSQRREGKGGTDLWMARRDSTDMPWDDAVNVGDTLNSRRNEMHPALSPNGLQLYFSSDREGSYDIWMSSRKSLNDPWNDPVRLDENVNHPNYMEVSPTLSPNGSRLYFSANRSSGPNVLSWDIFEVSVQDKQIPGDFDGDGTISTADIEALTNAIVDRSTDLRFDLNADNVVDLNDHSSWIELTNTWIGDVNLDGEFNSGDLVGIFKAGKYEVDLDAKWHEGDWTGDRRFDSSDLVAAFKDGGYEQGVRSAIVEVPEPSDAMLVIVACVLCWSRLRGAFVRNNIERIIWSMS